MAKQNQTGKSHQVKEHRPDKSLDVASKHVHNHITKTELPESSTSAAGSSSIEGQAAYLSDERLSTVQRQALTLQIGQTAGNQYLQRVMTQMTVSEQAPVTVGDQEVRPQQSIGSSHGNPPIVARKTPVTDEQTIEEPHVVFEPFGNLITYAQLAAAAQFVIGQIRADLREVGSGSHVHARGAEFIEGLRAWLPYLVQQGATRLTAAAVAQARLHFEEARAIREAIADAKHVDIQRELARVRDQARAAVQEAERLQPKLEDSLRAAYRSGDTDIIESAANALGNILDIGLGLHELVRKTAEAAASVQGVDLPAVGRYVAALDKLNRGFALFNLAYSRTQAEATTPLEEGMRQVAIAVGDFSALGTLVGLPAHMGLIANLYLVPMTTKILENISVLTGSLQKQNDVWVEVFGKPLREGVEPGPPEMWPFMVAVMKAPSAAAVPRISSNVADYLLEQRSKLEAGSGEEVPTEGWFLWRSLETERARDWVFNKRDRIWAMLYGSRKVPE